MALVIPKKLRKGSKAALVSLSWGMLGEDENAYILHSGIKNMTDMGLVPVIMPNALKGEKYLDEHPEARAEDLKAAFADDSIDAVICAIGGDDTFRLLPFLMEDEGFIRSVREHPKVFMGYSDTTTNHLMFHRLGLRTYYGPSFVSDIAEKGGVLPYTKSAVMSLFEGDGRTEILPSLCWYEERKSFSPEAAAVPRVMHEDSGFEPLGEWNSFSGELLGGCLESMSDMLTGDRYPEEKDIIAKYGIFPAMDEWRGKVLFIETSEECPDPEAYAHYLESLKNAGVFNAVNGIICGRPQNRMWYEEYKEIIPRFAGELPVLFNVDTGHSHPKTILPYGQKAECRKDRIILL